LIGAVTSLELGMRVFLKFAMVVASLAFAVALPAQAQTTGGYLLPTLTGPTSSETILFQGWTITISGCVQTINNATNQSCSVSEVVPSVVLGTLSLVFTSSTGGPLSISAPGVGNDLDITTLNVKSPTGLIGSMSNAINFTKSPGSLVPYSITSAYTVQGAPSAYASMSVSNVAILNSQIFAPAQTAVNGFTDTSNAPVTGSTATATLNSMTLNFTSAPEPMSSSLLAVGMIGLGLVRRKIRRSD
jgi:hypothetical protein